MAEAENGRDIGMVARDDILETIRRGTELLKPTGYGSIKEVAGLTGAAVARAPEMSAGPPSERMLIALALLEEAIL